MKKEIVDNLNNPQELERLYRGDRTGFKKAFDLVFPEHPNELLAQAWKERLNGESDISWGRRSDLVFIIVLSIIAGFLAKIPEFSGVNEEFFYPRNLSFLIFPFLTVYFFRSRKVSTKRILITIVIFLASNLYINLLPDNSGSDTLILACIHLPLFLWSVWGVSFVNFNSENMQMRLSFLRFNGDFLIMTSVILFAGVLLTGVTFGLFSLINLKIEQFYLQYIVVWGLVAAPLVSTYLIQSNPGLVNRVSPVIAKVFTPIVLLTLVSYLIAVLVTGKDPYNDREFLLVFNLLLIGVMAIILFSITETANETKSRLGTMLLLTLAVVTIIVNGIALSAILFRISEWGITPNRLAVLGGNILILINLLLVTYWLFKSYRNIAAIENVEVSIARYLPVYAAWSIIVVFAFPLIFGFS